MVSANPAVERTDTAYRAVSPLTLAALDATARVVWVGILGRPEPPAALGRLVGLAANIVCGWFANEWYLSHARKAISEVRSQGLSEVTHLEALAKRGGTNLAASLGFLVIFLLAAFVALILLEFFLKGA